MVEALKFMQNWWAPPTHPSEPDDDCDEVDEVGKHCHLCDELIGAVEPAVLITVVIGFHGHQRAGDVQTFTVFDDEGDYKYSPLIFHEECWGSMMDAILENTKDAPPCTTPGEVIKCSLCDSSIDEGEEFSHIQPMEIHVSPRRPFGETEVDFFEYGEAKPVCFSCMVIVDQLMEEDEDEEEDDEDYYE